MGIGLAAFVYGLATDLNGKCNAAGYTFCAVVRIALGFDTLTWYPPPPRSFSTNPKGPLPLRISSHHEESRAARQTHGRSINNGLLMDNIPCMLIVLLITQENYL
jgi:hypothetical protein